MASQMRSASGGRGLRRLVRLGPGRRWPDLALDYLEEARRSGGVWHLWGHSWEIERAGLWGPLREVLGAVGGQPGVRYLTNAQVLEQTSLTA